MMNRKGNQTLLWIVGIVIVAVLAIIGLGITKPWEQKPEDEFGRPALLDALRYDIRDHPFCEEFYGGNSSVVREPFIRTICEKHGYAEGEGRCINGDFEVSCTEKMR